MSLTQGSAFGQGRDQYFNVESIQSSPITTATISGQDYVLACNTPDNSLEVWAIDETGSLPVTFIERIPVGLEPVSVLWQASQQRFIVASFLSDSLTSGNLAAPSGPSSLTASLDRVINVGDEPIDLCLTPDESMVLVTFNNTSSIGAFSPDTLDPMMIPMNPAGLDPLLLLDPVLDRAIKEPHAIAARGGQVFVLGFKGGSTLLSQHDYDFDLYSRDLTTGNETALGGLGSTNWNMTFSSGGDLYVVGGEAQFNLPGGAKVRDALTGFVTTHLYRVRGAGSANPATFRRDLNLLPNGTAVMKPQALSMATDVVVYEPGNGQTKVFLSAFASDRVGVVSNVTNQDPNLWGIGRIDVPPAPGSMSARSGPRGLAIAGNRLYVLNRLDNSLAVIDASTESHLGTFKLASDPTPEHIVLGREYLYSADLSVSGFVSCASCHPDGRTDSIRWSLGAPVDQPAPTGPLDPFLAQFLDSPSGPVQNFRSDVNELITDGVHARKGGLVTQSLQGLLDFEVAPAEQDLVTLAPYHWRGDRSDFLAFNEGFVGLMGLTDIPGNGDLPAGIPEADMKRFEEFVNSISYPPNPNQSEERVYTGGIGSPDDLASGSGASRGLKLFHIHPSPDSTAGTNGRSCVQCHALPSGSNARITDTGTGGAVSVLNASGISTDTNERHLLKSAPLRGLVARETEVFQGFLSGSAPVSGLFGLTARGGRRSIARFNKAFNLLDDEVADINRYQREFDFGAAPMIGRVVTVVADSASVTAGSARMAAFEGQAKVANCGVAVTGNVGSVTLDYYYDPTTGLYRRVSAPTTAVTRSDLLNLVIAPGDRLVALATPLGSTLRVASESGSPATPSGPAPSGVRLESLETNTANRSVPLLVNNWIPGTGPDDFGWVHDNFFPTPPSLRALRRLQYGIRTQPSVFDFGLDELRHDAPRRLRVSGFRILEGAILHLHSPFDINGPPNTLVPPQSAASGATGASTRAKRRSFPIFPSEATASTGLPIWETAVELTPLRYYTLMNGGVRAPGVSITLNDTSSSLPEPPAPNTFDPFQYNYHYVEVENPDGTITAGGWFRMTLE